MSTCNRCRLHPSRQLLESTRRETRIRTIDPDIPGAVIVGHLPVGMAVEMPGSLQYPGPRPAWVMAEENTLTPVGDFQLLRRWLVPFKGGDDRMNPVLPLIVMVAENQDLAAHEPRENTSDTVAVVEPHGKIPEVIDHVIRLHDGIP